MGRARFFKWIIFSSIIFTVFLAGALVFYRRPPVLMVSDALFDQLYGMPRIRKARLLNSLRLFRRVKTVQVSDTAGADVILFAVEEASGAPYCAAFPYRYIEAAAQYSRKFPETPVLLLAGRERPSPEGAALRYFGTESKTDFYRAGRCAALFAEGAEGRMEGEIVCFQDEPVPGDDWDAFTQGLRDQGYAQTPVYMNSQSDYLPSEQTACAVITSGSPKFLEGASDIPVILFSWADPDSAPRRIKLIFDDSPWAQLFPALQRGLSAGAAADAPSQVLVLAERIPQKDRVKKIKDAALAKPLDLRGALK
ncbi:MAG: hypothetical protein LBD37_05885 [Treponema sp.]|jgi:hypothetical protein|nr:hypothetical protein [Treponema sp.]